MEHPVVKVTRILLEVERDNKHKGNFGLAQFNAETRMLLIEQQERIEELEAEIKRLKYIDLL